MSFSFGPNIARFDRTYWLPKNVKVHVHQALPSQELVPPVFYKIAKY